MQIRKYLNLQHLERSTRANVFLLLAASAVGVIASFLAVGSDWAEHDFNNLLLHHFWIACFVTPIGFVMLYIFAAKIFPFSAGSGIPETIACLNMADHPHLKKILSIRIIVGKFFLTLAAFAVGASIGREGPTVLIGAAVMYMLVYTKLARFQPDYVKRALIIAGGSAGIAAAFYTPLAGIVFAIEELSKSFEVRLTKILIIAILLSGFVCIMFASRQQFFDYSTGTLKTFSDWSSVFVCGVIGGFLGGVFTQCVLSSQKFLQRFHFNARCWFALLCGILMFLIGIASHNTVFGSSYSQTNNLIIAYHPPDLEFGILKFLATLITNLSGICGGILAPTLAIGAGIGQWVTLIFKHTSFSVVIILGMVSYFTGVVRSPITCFIIVLEMTGRYDLIIPLLAATIIAEYTASLVCNMPIYQGLADQLLARNVVN